jgi:hypothetical protein
MAVLGGDAISYERGIPVEGPPRARTAVIHVDLTPGQARPETVFRVGGVCCALEVSADNTLTKKSCGGSVSAGGLLPPWMSLASLNGGLPTRQRGNANLCP